MEVNKRRTWVPIALALAALALIGLYAIYGRPDVAFRSSDNNWADSEIQFKGRNFRVIVSNFEAYKILCSAPTATLVRTTPQHWENVFAWPSYLNDRKWRVPLGPRNPQIGDYYPPVAMTHCYNSGLSDATSQKVEAQAQEYFDKL